MFSGLALRENITDRVNFESLCTRISMDTVTQHIHLMSKFLLQLTVNHSLSKHTYFLRRIFFSRSQESMIQTAATIGTC